MNMMDSCPHEILDAIPAHIALLDPKGRIVAVNLAWREFGSVNALQSPDAALGQNYIEVCEQATGEGAEDGAKVAAGIRDVQSGKRKEFVFEYPCHSPTSPFWFQLKVVPTGKLPLPSTLVMHVDITERKIAEIALLETERQQRALAEKLAAETARLVSAQAVARIGSWQTDFSTLAVTWSAETYRIFEVSPAQFSNTHAEFLSFVHPDDRAKVDEAFRKSLHSRKVHKINHRIIVPGGGTKTVAESWKTITDSNGRPVSTYGTCQDITEQTVSERRAAELNSRFEVLISKAKLGILVHHNFVPIKVNEELVRMFGYASVDEILQMPDVRALFHTVEHERISRYNADRLTGGQAPEFYVIKGKRSDGQLIELENRAFRIQWGDDLVVCAMLTDVSEQRSLEAQLRQSQKMEAIGNLTGGLAHDFNNLLGIIIGNLDLLRSQPKGTAISDKQAAQLSGEALDAALRGADLNKRLLSFARRQTLRPERIDLNEHVKAIGKLLDRSLGENIQIKFSLSADIWPVDVDPSQLGASLVNISNNARDAMPNGGILTIATSNQTLDAAYCDFHPELAPGDYVLIELSDTGTGIPPDLLNQIFEPFFTTKDQGKGTGLGLSMVFGFVKQSAGHITVYSEVGHGTTFRLYLPRATSVARTKEKQVATIKGGHETILAVEDNESLRRMVVRQLKELGYQVLEAENGPAALKMLESGPIDLLFTDIVMPQGMSGYDLAKTAVLRWPGLKVLLTSGFPETKSNGHGDPRPNMPLLTKPYRKDDLALALRKVFETL